MAVTTQEFEKIHKIQHRKLKRKDLVQPMEKRLSIEEIQEKLGLDNIRPIVPSASDEKDMLTKGDCYREWNEEELIKFYYDGK